MDSYQWINALFENLAIPIIAAIGIIVVNVVKSFGKKITDSIVAKNEAESLEKVFAVKSYVIQEISTIVEAAVASNMQIAEDMKKAGQKLTEEQQYQLQQSAKELVLNSLPASLTQEDGSMIQIIGGQEKLDALISAMMEKSVYEYKIKKSTKNTTVEIPAEMSEATAKTKKTYSVNPLDLYGRK